MVTSRQAEVVKLRETGLTYKEIGLRFGICKERVRQILKVQPGRKKPARNEPGALLTIAEAAEFLNVHVNTVRRWSNNGLLTSYRIGPRGDRRFKRKDVNSLLQGSKEY